MWEVKTRTTTDPEENKADPTFTRKHLDDHQVFWKNVLRTFQEGFGLRTITQNDRISEY